MKNSKSKMSVIFLAIIAITVLIPALFPKSYAKIIKVKENNFSITKNSVGNVYKYGVPIETTSNYYSIELIYYYSEDESEYLYGTIYQSYSVHNDYYLGYVDNYSYNSVDLKQISDYWEVKNVFEQSSSLVVELYPVIVKQPEESPTFSVKCDEESINYSDNTKCTLSVENYIFDQSPLTFNFNLDEFELINLEPTEYFKLDEDNGVYTITTQYLNTELEGIPILNFNIKPIKGESTIENVKIENLSYNGIRYDKKIDTTVDIKKGEDTIKNLNNIKNPLTKSQILILKIFGISFILIVVSAILLNNKKKNV